MHPDAGMAVVVVAPAVEIGAESARLFEAVEPGWELGPVFQGLELRLAERVVVTDVGPGVRLRDAEVGE